MASKIQFVIVTLYISLITFCGASKTNNVQANKDPIKMANKKIALSFLKEFFGNKSIEAADKYISSEKYIQHNPLLANGKEALKIAAIEWFRLEPNKQKIEVKRVAADNDLVWIHHKFSWTGKEMAVVDIFRLDKGKIVEHWDVMQQVVAKSENPNTVF